MQNNYYFLRRITPLLSESLREMTLTSCFSQNKEELILGFELKAKSFFIRAALNPGFTCLSFPEEFHRSKSNSVNIFPALIGCKVESVRQFLNERSFSIEFENNYSVLFKLHGNRSNILLFEGKELKALFKNNIEKDKSIEKNSLERPLMQDLKSFEEADGNYKQLFPTFGIVVDLYLKEKEYETLDPKEKWELIQNVLKKLNDTDYYITILNRKLVFSLINIGDVIETHKDPIKSINTFFVLYTSKYYLEKEKVQVLSKIEREIKNSVNYISRTMEKWQEIESSFQNTQTADIIMANLNNIPANSMEVELFNFYTNMPIKIKLKHNLSPQKNAELYYKKAKNDKVQIEYLNRNINFKKNLLSSLEAHVKNITGFDKIKDLRNYIKEFHLNKDSSKAEEFPFKVFEFEGYEIFVGKNAQNNEILTHQFATKNDLWLHARDVSGSHVVIRDKPGQNFPRHVIERAAEIAAYNSKRRNDSFCPVIYTLKKYVRKIKGAPVGTVQCLKEEVLMVKPRGSEKS